MTASATTTTTTSASATARTSARTRALLELRHDCHLIVGVSFGGCEFGRLHVGVFGFGEGGCVAEEVSEVNV